MLEIPLAACIFAFVDIWDDLTKDPACRRTWPDSETIRYLLKQMGILFDPEVVVVFQIIMALNRS